MYDGFERIETASGSVWFDPSLGNLRDVRFRAGGRELDPLHGAPWLDDPAVQTDEGIAPVERRLSGDFFCAPFGGNDVDGGPIHGWTANSRWRVDSASPGGLELSLDHSVYGARIEKSLRLAADAPLLYQRHRIVGGEGGLTAAHHPMVRLAGAGRICFSPKRAVLTPGVPLEPGRNVLVPGARSTDLRQVPGSVGRNIDIGRLPLGERHEDFATLVEAPVEGQVRAPGAALGWTAILREVEDDIVFFLKDPAALPVTMLWWSNGGRDYAPWNGRHLGVVGVEDGRAAGAEGFAAALTDNPVSLEGVPTAFRLAPDVSHDIRHVIGAVGRPAGWSEIVDIVIDAGEVRLVDRSGESRVMPFDPSFF